MDLNTLNIYRIGCVIVSAKTLQNRLNSYFNRRISELGIDITASQADILMYLFLHMDSEVNPIDIESFYGMSRPTVHGLLKRLWKKGYIDYRESEKNKKYKAVVLSDRMIALQGTLENCVLEGCKAILTGISVEERKIFLGVIQKINENILVETE